MMTKEGAVREIIRQACTSRNSKASYKRAVKALVLLGLNENETHSILKDLEYVSWSTGRLHEMYVDK
jgi:hypothetical protein